ncbi:hypothetical protein JCM8547_008279 [Rhodosporidiobolus lusitaniae]
MPVRRRPLPHRGPPPFPEPWVYRPARRDFLALALTCKAWHAIGIEQLYREINVEADRAAQVVEALKRNDGRAQLVHNLTVWPRSAKAMPHEEGLAAEDRRHHRPRPAVHSTCSHFAQGIRTIQLLQPFDLQSIVRIFAKTSELEHFHLRLESKSRVILSSIGKPASGLRVRSLYLAVQLKYPADNYVPFLLSLFDPAALLSLNGMFSDSEEGIFPFLSRAGNLTALRLNWQITQTTLLRTLSILPAVPSLRTFLIRNKRDRSASRWASIHPILQAAIFTSELAMFLESRLSLPLRVVRTFKANSNPLHSWGDSGSEPMLLRKQLRGGAEAEVFEWVEIPQPNEAEQHERGKLE